MVGYIYLITDTTNGMKYTGKHHYHIEGQLDPNYHGSGVIIKNIYKKRPETLKEEYIKTCYSEEEMCSDEQYYIKVFKTLYPNGYNLTEGGDGVIPCEETRRKNSENHWDCSGEKNPMYGKKHTEEARRKMSENHWDCSGENHYMFGKHHTEESKRKNRESNLGKPSAFKGKKHTEETRKKMSENHYDCSGEKNPMFGKHFSEETKRKMRVAKIGKPNLKLSKKVLQFTLDGEFVKEWPSAAECGRNGFNSSKICLCCQGKRKSHKGYIWKYKE